MTQSVSLWLRSVTCALPFLVAVPAFAQNFTLQIFHAGDQEAGVPAIQDAPRFSAVLTRLRQENPTLPTLTLGSGDAYIPGLFFSASADSSLQPLLGKVGAGRADIVIQNKLGFQAITFGNHEFDFGTASVKSLLAVDGAYVGAQFPYLSANLDFSPNADLNPLVVADGQDGSTLRNAIAKHVFFTVGGERVAVIGATTPTLASISSSGNVGILPSRNADNVALAAELQRTVDAVKATGVNKIILMTHMQQLAIERALATLMRDVDVIIAGGNHGVNANSNRPIRQGDQVVGPYPELFTNAGGEPLALLNCASNYKYVCRFIAEYTSTGVLVPSSITVENSGAFATDAAGVTAVGGDVARDADPDIVAIANAINEVIIGLESSIFGRSTVYLNGRRASSDRFGGVRQEETNLGNLTADANLYLAQLADPTTTLSIKNGGGIRDQIGRVVSPAGSTSADDVVYLPTEAVPDAGKQEGDISQTDIANSLRFNNGLTVLTVTATELKALAEHGVAASGGSATPGRFPQIGGFAFSFDLTRAAGNRVRTLRVFDSNGAEPGGASDVVVENGQVVGNPNRTFRLVTLGFLADGGDSYPFPQTNRVNLTAENTPVTGGDTFAAVGSEQDALARYLRAQFDANRPFMQADTPRALDTRLQNLAAREDTVAEVRSQLEGLAVRAVVNPGDNLLIGGFIIDGPSMKRVAMSAKGPSLTAAGITTPLADPQIQLVQAGTVIATNDNWATDENSGVLTALNRAPTDAREAALVRDLMPGAYTLLVTGADATSGVALMEIYDVGVLDGVTRLRGLAARGLAAPGDISLIGGVALRGAGMNTLVITARGVSMGNIGTATLIADPQMVLSQLMGNSAMVLTSNDNWTTSPAQDALGSLGLGPTESGLVIDLASGNYTPVVSPVANTAQGVTLLEIYERP